MYDKITGGRRRAVRIPRVSSVARVTRRSGIPGVAYANPRSARPMAVARVGARPNAAVSRTAAFACAGRHATAYVLSSAATTGLGGRAGPAVDCPRRSAVVVCRDVVTVLVHARAERRVFLVGAATHILRPSSTARLRGDTVVGTIRPTTVRPAALACARRRAPSIRARINASVYARVLPGILSNVWQTGIYASVPQYVVRSCISQSGVKTGVVNHRIATRVHACVGGIIGGIGRTGRVGPSVEGGVGSAAGVLSTVEGWLPYVCTAIVTTAGPDAHFVRTTDKAGKARTVVEAPLPFFPRLRNTDACRE